MSTPIALMAPLASKTPLGWVLKETPPLVLIRMLASERLVTPAKIVFGVAVGAAFSRAATVGSKKPRFTDEKVLPSVLR